MKDLLIGLALLSGPAIVFAAFGTGGLDAFDDGAAPAPAGASVEAGRIAFAENCAVCHGRIAEGTRAGPALAGHAGSSATSDAGAFRQAVRTGVPPRSAGSAGMPAFAAISDAELDRMLSFLRGLEGGSATN